MSTGAQLLQKIKNNKSVLVSETKSKLNEYLNKSKTLWVREKTYGDYSEEDIKEIVDYFESKSDKTAAVFCTGNRDGIGEYSGVKWIITVHPRQDAKQSLEEIMEIDNGDLYGLAQLIFYFNHEPTKSGVEENFLCYIFRKITKTTMIGSNARAFFAFYSNQKNRKIDPDASKCELYMKEFAVYRVCEEYKVYKGNNNKNKDILSDSILLWIEYLVKNKVERERTKKFLRFFVEAENIEDADVDKMIAKLDAEMQESQIQEVVDDANNLKATEVSSVDSEIAQPLTAPAPKADDQMHQLVGFFENLLRATPYAFKYQIDPVTNQFLFEKAALVGEAEASAPAQKKPKTDDSGFVITGAQSDEDEEEYDTVMDRINANQ